MPDDEGRAGLDNRRKVRLAAGLALLVLLVAFVLDNTDDVPVGFVVGDSDVPLIIVLVATALIGAVLDRTVTWLRRR